MVKPHRTSTSISKEQIYIAECKSGASEGFPHVLLVIGRDRILKGHFSQLVESLSLNSASKPLFKST